MLFNSYIFVLLFLPLCLLGYFGLNHLRKPVLAQVFLLAMSLWFYGYFNSSYLTVILGSILFNYFISLLLRRGQRQRKRRFLAGIAIFFNVGVLFYFKYYDFFIENINLVFQTGFPLRHILLPLGISFFTFQQLSYIIDCYKGEVPPYGFLQYASFVTFFPQLIAGPIVTHDELIPQFMSAHRKKYHWENFSRGLYLFALGLSKKVLLADTFGNAANLGFAQIDLLDSTNAILTMLAYTIQIYFDFSGYCDMAVGIGKMMNIDLPVNFDSPYKALTITQFWERWHKTLTRFFTKYIYIPLGGNRKGEGRTALHVLIVFLVSGLWHGADWTFILWGFCHGLFSVLTRKGKRFVNVIPNVLNWFVTFSFVNLTWVLFRAGTVREAFLLIGRIFSFRFGPVRSDLADCFRLPEWEFLFSLGPLEAVSRRYPALYLVLFFLAAFLLLFGSKNAYEKMLAFRPRPSYALLTALLLAWCIFSFSGITTFLYFNF